MNQILMNIEDSDEVVKKIKNTSGKKKSWGL